MNKTNYKTFVRYLNVTDLRKQVQLSLAHSGTDVRILAGRLAFQMHVYELALEGTETRHLCEVFEFQAARFCLSIIIPLGE